MRRAGFLLLLIVALTLELQHYENGHPRSPPRRATPARVDEAQTARLLTLLDFWSEKLVPDILLEHARARALQAGDAAKAARLEPEVRRRLLQVQSFGTSVAKELALERRNSAARRVRTAAIAWAAWASAVLRQSHAPRTGQIAGLEAAAVRLHQAAYAAVDAAARTAAR